MTVPDSGQLVADMTQYPSYAQAIMPASDRNFGSNGQGTNVKVAREAQRNQKFQQYNSTSGKTSSAAWKQPDLPAGHKPNPAFADDQVRDAVDLPKPLTTEPLEAHLEGIADRSSHLPRPAYDLPLASVGPALPLTPPQVIINNVNINYNNYIITCTNESQHHLPRAPHLLGNSGSLGPQAFSQANVLSQSLPKVTS